MVEVQRREFYEFGVSNYGETVECEDCGKEMTMPERGDLDADMEEPFWIRHGNVFRSYCEQDFCDRMFEGDEPMDSSSRSTVSGEVENQP